MRPVKVMVGERDEKRVVVIERADTACIGKSLTWCCVIILSMGVPRIILYLIISISVLRKREKINSNIPFCMHIPQTL